MSKITKEDLYKENTFYEYGDNPALKNLMEIMV